MRGTIAIFIMIVFAGIPSKSSALTLVDKGIPKAKIIVAADAARTVNYAADELQTYIEKITGTKLPIEKAGPDQKPVIGGDQNYIFVGESIYTKKLGINVDEMKSDGYRIVCRDNHLVLVGRDYRGKLMEGFRHPFRLRESYNAKLGLGVYGETGTLYAVYGFLESLGVRWFMPGELGEVVPERKTIEVKNTDIKREPAFEYRYIYFTNFRGDEEGVKWFKRTGYGARHVVNINHSFYLFQKYRDSHPEYFAIVDGERDFDKTCAGKGSLCLSEEKGLSRMVSDIREYFNSHPDVRMYPVMPNDAYERICECERCQGKDDPSMGPDGKFSDYVWRFVNEVAKEVYKSHPDKQIICCAYGHYRLPPKTIKAFSPNVAVMICKVRKDYWDKEYKNKIYDVVGKWRTKVDNVYIWEYYNWHDRAKKYPHKYRYLIGTPVAFFNIVKDDLRYLKRNGIIGEFIEVDNFSWPGLLHFTMYATAKLLWDPDRDVKKLLADYCASFYGPGGKAMTSFFVRAEQLWTTTTPRERLYSPAVIDELQDYLWQARAKTSGAYRKRVELLINETSPMLELRRRSTVASQPVAPGRQENLLPNPGFERDENNDRIPDGWIYKNVSNSRGIGVWDQESTYEGSSSIKIEKSNNLGHSQWILKDSIAARPGVKYTFSCWYKTQQDGDPTFTMLNAKRRYITSVRFKLSGAKNGWKPFEGDFIAHPETRFLAFALHRYGRKGKVSWDKLTLIEGTRVVESPPGKIIMAKLSPEEADEVSKGTVLSLQDYRFSVSSGAKRKVRDSTASDGFCAWSPGDAPSWPIQWRLTYDDTAKLMRDFHYGLYARVKVKKFQNEGDAFSFICHDRVRGLSFMPRGTVPAKEMRNGAWETYRLASFVPQAGQAVIISPGGKNVSDMYVDKFFLVPDTEKKEEMTFKKALRSNRFSAKVKTFGYASIETKDIKNIKVKSFPRKNWIVYDDSFNGIIVDYKTPRGYVHRVFLGLGLLGEKIKEETEKVPSLGKGKAKGDRFVNLGSKSLLGRGKDFDIDLGKYAPENWDGKAWLHFGLANTGDESVYNVLLVEPDRYKIEILARRNDYGDCYYAIIN